MGDQFAAQASGALNLSMDFRGGTSTSVTFNEDLYYQRHWIPK